MEAPGEDTPEHVLIPLTEKPKRIYSIFIFVILPPECFHIQPIVESVDERADKLSVMKQANLLRWGENKISVSRVQFVGGQYLTYEYGAVHDDKDHTEYHR